MTLSQEITGYATNLFDVAGFARLSDKKVLLIVGLETTPDRDLDEFPANCTDMREENPDCIRCNKCIECCLVWALKPYTIMMAG